MKPRSQLLATLALFFLAWNADAQSTGVRSTRTGKDPFQYGSIERTKLLQQGRGRSNDALKYGAVDRRTLLTTGKSIYKPKPKRTYFRR